MWNCKKCQAPNLESNVVCDSCGQIRNESQEQNDLWPKPPLAKNNNSDDFHNNTNEEIEKELGNIVDKFIYNKKLERQNKYNQDKTTKLISLGLFKTVYDVNNTGDLNEYPFEGFPSINGKMTKVRYKKVVPNIPDEVYKDLIDLTKEEPRDIADEITQDVYESSNVFIDSNNSVASLFKWIAYITYVGGFIAGIALGRVTTSSGTFYKTTTTEFSFALALIYWASAFISGSIFLGFSEIINLLSQICSKKLSIKKVKEK